MAHDGGNSFKLHVTSLSVLKVVRESDSICSRAI